MVHESIMAGKPITTLNNILVRSIIPLETLREERWEECSVAYNEEAMKGFLVWTLCCLELHDNCRQRPT